MSYALYDVEFTVKEFISEEEEDVGYHNIRHHYVKIDSKNMSNPLAAIESILSEIFPCGKVTVLSFKFLETCSD